MTSLRKVIFGICVWMVALTSLTFADILVDRSRQGCHSSGELYVQQDSELQIYIEFGGDAPGGVGEVGGTVRFKKTGQRTSRSCSAPLTRHTGGGTTRATCEKFFSSGEWEYQVRGESNDFACKSHRLCVSEGLDCDR